MPKDTNDSASLFMFHNRGVVVIVNDKLLPSEPFDVNFVSVIANDLFNPHANLDHKRNNGSATVASNRGKKRIVSSASTRYAQHRSDDHGIMH